MRTTLAVLLLLFLGASTSFAPNLSVGVIQRTTASTTPSYRTALRVFVLDLAGVDTGVGNTTAVLEGIVDALSDRNLRVDFDFPPNFPSGGISYANVTFDVFTVTTWSEYQKLVVSGDNLILVSLHGQYLPVPLGYTREQWLGILLSAMADRSITWVHLGGYPLSWTWTQGVGPQEWGPQGFQTLAGFASWTDSAIAAPFSNSKVAQETSLLRDLISNGWVESENVQLSGIGLVELNEFSLSTVNGKFWFWPALYNVDAGGGITYSSGVAEMVTGSGGRTTGSFVDFDPGGFVNGLGTAIQVNVDYVKGFLGTILSLYLPVAEPVNEMRLAANEIQMQQLSGHTVGLEQATSLLSQAQSQYEAGHQFPSLMLAKQALSMAQEASLSFLSKAYPYLVIVGGIVGLGLVLAFAQVGPYAIGSVLGVARPRFLRRKKPKEKPPKTE